MGDNFNGQSVRKSKKTCLKNLVKVIEYDTRSVTGHNLRTLMLNSSTDNIKNLMPKHADNDYFEVPEGEEYRIEFIKELIEVKNNTYKVDGFNNEELDDILCFLCTS